MKKRVIVFLLSMALLLCGVHTFTAKASSNVFSIKSTSVATKSDNVIAKISNQDEGISTDATLHHLGDYAEYEVALENKSEQDITIETISSKSSNKYLTLSYADYAGTEVAAGDIFIFKFKIQYTSALSDLERRMQDFPATLTIKYDGGETSIEINPNTGDRIVSLFVILIASTAGIIVAITHIKKTSSRTRIASIVATIAAISASIALPTIANASSDFFELPLNNQVSIKEKLLVNYNDGTNDRQLIINYGEKLNPIDYTKPGYEFYGWLSPDGSPFDFDTPITDDIELIPDIEAIEYNITYDLQGGTLTEENPSSYTIEQTVTIANQPEKENAEFLGWTGSNGDSPEKEISFSAETGEKNYTANYIAKTAYLDTGKTINEKLKHLSGSPRATYNSYNDTISNIIKADSLPSDFAPTEDNIISTADSNPIYAWYEASSRTINIYSPARKIAANEDSSYLFYYLYNLVDASFLSSLDTSNVIDLSYFLRSTKLANLNPLRGWNTSSFQNLSNAFSDNSALTNISALETWDTSNVTLVNSLFASDKNLLNFSPIKHWNTSNVTGMSSVFSYTGIRNADDIKTYHYDGDDHVSWDTSNVTTMGYMFSGAKQLHDISGVSTWDTSKVTSLDYTFAYNESLTDLEPLSSWNVASLTSLDRTFYNNKNIRSLHALRNWGNAKLKKLNFTFQNCSLTDISAVANWDTSEATQLTGVFYENPDLSDISALASWDTTNATNIGYVFGMTAVTDISPIQNWNTDNVTDIQSFFRGLSNLTDISAVSDWKLKKVTRMDNLFDGASSLVDLSPIAGWRPVVQDTPYMFNGASSITSVAALSDWSKSYLKNAAYMFQNATSLTDISGLRSMNKAQNISYMFNGASSLADLSPLSTWTGKSITLANSAFKGMTSLTDVSPLAQWNVSNINQASEMFYGDRNVTSYAPLENWQFKNGALIDRIFSGAPAGTPLPSWAP